MITVLVVLVLVLIVFSGWNLWSLSDLKKHNRSKQEIKDDRYYELKYKIEFIIAIAILIIGGSSFIGYKWYDGINKEVENKLKKATTSIEQFEKRNTDLIKLSDNTKDSLESLGKQAQKTRKDFSLLSTEIRTINSKSIIKQDIYLIDKIYFPNVSMNYRFKYENLKTKRGDHLPIFDEPPFLVIVPESAVEFRKAYVGKDYFVLEILNSYGDIDSIFFGIMVSKK